MDHARIEDAQRSLCDRFSAPFVSTPPDEIIGFARATAGRQAINGLRHPQVPGTSGWYIWCGGSFSDAEDFFEPQHARHVYEVVPEASHLLGLAAGYRLLLAGSYLDVWYDEKLLDV
jgi:hypothetical protein